MITQENFDLYKDDLQNSPIFFQYFSKMIYPQDYEKFEVVLNSTGKSFVGTVEEIEDYVREYLQTQIEV